MPRPYRIQGEGCFYHITSRGDDRKKIFISEYDYRKFLEYILAAREKYKFHFYAYCLMSNHYHLLIETTQPNVSRIMHYINGSYTTYYNVKRRKCGHVFQGRFKSILVEKEAYLLELSRYIHLNPLRAKMVALPEEYKWSSYAGYLNKNGDGYIDKDKINEYITIKSNKYRQFVLDGLNIKQNPFVNLYAGFILGSEYFIKDKLKILKEEVETKDFSYKKAFRPAIDPETIISSVARYYKKTNQDILSLNKRPVTIKNIAVYLIKRYTALTNNVIGKLFSLTYSAVSKAAKNIESLIAQDKRLKEETEKIISTFKV